MVGKGSLVVEKRAAGRGKEIQQESKGLEDEGLRARKKELRGSQTRKKIHRQESLAGSSR